MDDTIKVNFDNVYQTIGELREHLDTNVLNAADSQYKEIEAMLEQVDGATNAKLITTMQMNHEKTVMVANTLQKLLLLIETATQEMQKEDQYLSEQLGTGKV